jgi:rRNA-processing protein FCF1
VKHVEELSIPELTSEQIEELCSIAEETARKNVLSKISQKRIETLNISVEAEGTKPVTLAIDMNVVLSPIMKDYDVKKLVDEAVKAAFVVAEKYLRELKWRSQK